ncbi:MAG: nickel-dependent hydrogenase large subunit [candidate division KSB1 bacterium]|nr:nickel-dependent hydrogenase large subunit [candidate division KSB1 bacterium]
MTGNNIPIGPYHPLLEEAEYFNLVIDGETVVDIDMDIGWMHRGHEFISEQKTFTQSIYLVERICGICSTSHPIACVHAFEDVDNIEIPERAAYIRTLVGELERIHSHLLWLGLAGHFIGYDTVWMWAWKYREPVLQMFEIISGNRNHYGMMRIGGVAQDVDPAVIPELNKHLDMIDKKMAMIAKVAKDDPVLRSRLKRVGVLSKQDAIDYCAVGPTARASDVHTDVRKDEPMDAYPWVDFDEIVLPNGDVYDKLVVRVLETLESTKICRQCLEKLKTVKGPVLNNVKEISAGEGLGRYEAPRGEVFHFVKTDGSNRPVRHKVRAPSYVNIPTFTASCKGIPVADALITLASVDPCYCCTERSFKLMDVNHDPCTLDILALSREKTQQIRRELHVD